MMTKRAVVRASLAVFILVAAIAASRALILKPVFANVLRFSSSSTQSTVEVIVSNPNPVHMGGTLTLQVIQVNGVPRTWPAGYIEFPAGNSNHRVILPFAITGVRWARVSGAAPCW